MPIDDSGVTAPPDQMVDRRVIGPAPGEAPIFSHLWRFLETVLASEAKTRRAALLPGLTLGTVVLGVVAILALCTNSAP